LTVAIHLAEHSLGLAETADERGAALNDLGQALQILWSLQPSIGLMERAIAAHCDALDELPRERVELKWANTKNRLGNALLSFGEGQESPLWLHGALAAYDEALQVHTRTSAREDWVTAKNNMGAALAELAMRERSVARLDEAIVILKEVVNETSRIDEPLLWAASQNNLGNALKTLGQNTVGTASLLEAKEAIEAALDMYDDQQPIPRAKTHLNLSSVNGALFDKTKDPTWLSLANEYALAARLVFSAVDAVSEVAKCDRILAQVAARQVP
jgi:tetratricopeptide (TPR) repeat protein